MASIAISDLRPAGSELFLDSESFMDDLTDGEISIQGGLTPFWASVVVVGSAATLGGAISASIGILSRPRR